MFVICEFAIWTNNFAITLLSKCTCLLMFILCYNNCLNLLSMDLCFIYYSFWFYKYNIWVMPLSIPKDLISSRWFVGCGGC
jgi:hypothetical protein